jgi:pilin isopeptide linkage protein
VTVEDDGSGKLSITPVYQIGTIASFGTGVKVNVLTWNIINQNVNLLQTNANAGIAAASVDDSEEDSDESSEEESSEGESSASVSGVKFTNEYNAVGYATLTGTKVLTGNRDEAIGADEFTFSVKETVNGVTNEVATGKTLASTTSSDSATIQFEHKDGALENGATFSYTAADIGRHTYVITEDKKEDALIDYDTNEVTVTVIVTDNGNGTLNTEVEYPENADGTEATEVKFVNTYHIPVPTGVRVDILPYVMMIAIAVCPIMLLTICKRKKRSVRRR